ncbi:NAD(P)-binding protein, partial [Hortaea werneckii]
MSAAAKARVQALSEQLVRPREDPGQFEGIPRIPTIAGDSSGQRVKGKVVIVTGCNSPLGIGRASAHLYARNGARAVFICDYKTDHLETHKRELKSLYPEVEVHAQQIDAGEETDVERVVNEALTTYGRLDVFFANAGISHLPSRIFEASADDFMKTMRTNALGVFLATKHGARGMLQTSKEKPYPGGSIIGTASVAGLRSNAGATDYSASKAAVISIMQTACYQLTGTGIRCNAVCPGIIETGMTSL